MKYSKEIITILLLVLFQMIVLQVVSQVKYISGKDTTIQYTLSENRAIAALLYIGAYNTTKTELQATKIKNLQGLVANYQSDSARYQSLLFNMQTKFQIADSSYNKEYKDNLKLQTKIKRYTPIFYGSVGLNVLLILLLL